MRNRHLGSTLDEFLDDEELLEEVTLAAKKRGMALQLEEALRSTHITKSELAVRLGTSRAQVDRLLDPTNESVTLRSLFRIGSELGLELHVAFVRSVVWKSRKAQVGRRPTHRARRQKQSDVATPTT